MKFSIFLDFVDIPIFIFFKFIRFIFFVNISYNETSAYKKTEADEDNNNDHDGTGLASVARNFSEESPTVDAVCIINTGAAA